MKKRSITEKEFAELLDVLRKGTIKNAKRNKWRPSELAITLATLPDTIKKRFKVEKDGK